MTTTPDIAVLGMAIDSRPVSQGTAELDKMTAAGGRTEAATQKLTATQQAFGQATTNAVSPLREMAAAIQKVDAEQKAAYQSTQKLTAATVDATAASGQLVAAHTRMVGAADAHVQAFKRLGTQFTLNRAQMQELTAVARHSFDQLAAGGSAFTVLSTHAASLGEVLGMSEGGAGAALTALGALVTPTVIGVGAIGAALVLGAKAAHDHEEAMNSLSQTVAGTGRLAGVTAGQLNDAAKQGAASADISISAARGLAQGYASAGVQGQATIAGLTGITAQFATTMGTTSDKAEDYLIKAFSDPSAGAAQLQASLGLLSAEQLKQIQNLDEQGNKAAAQSVLLHALQDALQGTASHTTEAGREMGILAAFFGNAYDAAGDLIGRLHELATFDFSGLVDRQAKEIAQKVHDAQAAVAQLNQLETNGNVGSMSLTDAASRTSLTNQANAKLTAARAASTLGHADTASTALAEYRAMADSATYYVAAGTKAHAVSDAQVKAAGAVSVAEKKAAAEEVERANLLNTTMTSEDRARKISDAGRVAAATAQAAASKKSESAAESAAKAAAKRQEELAREAAATIATTNATLDLAEAYGKGDEAVAQATARAEASSKAIKAQGDVDAFVQRQLDLNAAKAAASAAKAADTLDFQTGAQERANAAVAAGTITSTQATQQVQLEVKVHELAAAGAGAHGRAAKDLSDAIDKVTASTKDSNAAARDAQLLSQNADLKDQLELLDLQYKLISATNMERAVEVAQLQAEQAVRARGGDPASGEGATYVANQKALAAANERNKTATDNYNASLSFTSSLLSEIDSNAQAVSSVLTQGFGDAGSALGGLLTAQTGYAAAQAQIELKRSEANKAAGNDADALKRIEILATQESATAQLKHYSDVLSAMRGFFKEGSAGYKALTVAAQIYAAVQLANSFKTSAAGAPTGAGASTGGLGSLGGIANGIGGLLGLGGSSAAAGAISAGSAFSGAAVGASGLTSASSVLAAGGASAGGLGGLLGGAGAALASNPIGWGIAAVGIVGSIFGAFNGGAEKAKKEAERAAAAQQALADAQNAAAAAAQKAADVLKEQRGIQIDLMNAIGETAAATAAQRQDELAALDPSNRSLKQLYYDATDAQTAFDTATQAVSDAQSALTDAYNNASSAITDTHDKFASFVSTLQDFRDSLTTGSLALNDPYQQTALTRAKFGSTADLATSGNEAALTALPQVAQDFLTASQATAKSQVEYNRDLAAVKRATQAAQDYAQNQVDIADLQLAALNAQVSGLGVINNSVLTGAQQVAAAVNNLAAAQGSLAAAQALKDSAKTAADAGLAAIPAQQDWSVGGTLWNQQAAAGASNPWVTSHTESQVVADWNAKASDFIQEYNNFKNAGLTLSALDAYWHLTPGMGAAYAAKNGLPTFATGGSMMVNAVGGIDRNVLSINGHPSAMVDQGEHITVTRRGQSTDADSGEPVMTQGQADQILRTLVAIAKTNSSLDRREGRREVNGLGVRGVEPDAPVLVKIVEDA